MPQGHSGCGWGWGCVYNMKYERKWLWWTSRQRINQRAGPDCRTQPESREPLTWIKWIKCGDFDFKEVVVRRTTYDLLIWFLWLLETEPLYSSGPANPSIPPLLHCCCLFMLFDSSENAAMRLKSNKFFSAHRGSPGARAAVADALSGQHPSASGQLRLRLRLWLCLGVFKCRLCALIKYCFLFSLLLIPLRLCVAVGGN